MDDAFYKERYPDATVMAIAGGADQYYEGFDFPPKPDDIYFKPDKIITSDNFALDLGKATKASLVVLDTKEPQDGVIVLERQDEGKILIPGDSLQNLERTQNQWNCIGRTMMGMMGFLKPYNVGPAWASISKTTKEEMESKLLNLKFDHVLPSHGRPVIGQAYKKYEPAIQELKL